MGIPTTLRGISATPGSNSPAGTDVIGSNADDYLRSIQSVFRQYLASVASNITSATTTDLSTADGFWVTITGTTTITALGTEQAGIWYVLTFSGALTLTHNGTSLILPGAANILTAAGDSCLAQSLGSGNWRIHAYQKASGKAVINTANTQPTRTALTSGSGTYTTPSGATRINVRIWGAGGGAGASGTGAFGAASTAGGNTTFSTLTANGGGAGPSSTTLVFAAGGSASGGDVNLTGMDGMASASISYSAANSGDGGVTSLGGAGRGSYPGGPGQSAKGNTGSGGGGAGGNAGVAPGGSGAAGGFSEKLITAPAGTYSYAVGAKGTGGVAGTSGFNGGDGAAGLIEIDEYYN